MSSSSSSAAAGPAANDVPSVHSGQPPPPPPGGSATKSSSPAPSGRARTFKVIVIGDSGVGKTCLSFRFCSGHFPGATEATIGVDFRERVVQLRGGHARAPAARARLQLWDTAGQERFRRSMVSHYYRNVDAVVLVYDVTRRSSFDAMAQWLEECRSHGLDGDRVPMLMVGNKCDEDGDRVAVPTNEAQRFADDHSIPLFETSAKDDSRADHVEAIFMTLAHKVNASRPMMALKKGQGQGQGREGNGERRIIFKNEAYKDDGGGGGFLGSCCSS